MTVEQSDLEMIEKMVYRSADDIAISIARSFERLEERIDAAESRLFGRLSELEEDLQRPVSAD